MPSSHTPERSQIDAPTPPDVKARALGLAHDDLDTAIAALLQSGLGDDLLISRLKKRKLQIRDEIAALTQTGPVAQAS